MSEKSWMPPRYLKWLIVLAVVLHFVVPIRKVIDPPVSYIGLIPIVLAIYLNLVAGRFFLDAETSIKPYHKPSALVIQGVYRRTRNPMYLGFVLLLFGLSWLMGTLSPFVTPVLMFLVLERLFIPYEEHALTEVFGSQYEEYKLRVHRWI